MPEGVYNLAIIGLGHVASHHIAAIADSPRFRLVAACDTDSSRFSLLEPSVQSFTELDEMLAHADPDAVIVASPNKLHVSHGLKVMAAGKRVVMEKPLAESQEVFETFEQQKREMSGRCTVALHAAFGMEVAWFCEAAENDRFRRGELTSFAARFYDPYFEGGVLQERARSLGGSWLDSGINALSVICRMIDPGALVLQDSRMTRVSGADCSEVQGTVDFQFFSRDAGGNGSIDTNWTLGRNSKSTILEYGAGRRFILDHSGQCVLLQEGQQERLLFSCGNGRPRLTNHYAGVFEDLALQMDTNRDNFDYGRRLHELVYQAEQWQPGQVAVKGRSAEDTISL